MEMYKIMREKHRKVMNIYTNIKIHRKIMQINKILICHESRGSEYYQKVTQNEWKLLKLSQESHRNQYWSKKL